MRLLWRLFHLRRPYDAGTTRTFGLRDRLQKFLGVHLTGTQPPNACARQLTLRSLPRRRLRAALAARAGKVALKMCIEKKKMYKEKALACKTEA